MLMGIVFFLLTYLVLVLAVVVVFAAVAVYLRWQLKHQWRRITMEAARGGWDGARESLESSLSFASFLLLGAMGRSMLRAALRDGV